MEEKGRKDEPTQRKCIGRREDCGGLSKATL